MPSSATLLTLRHQDGDLVYAVVPERETGFTTSEGRFSFSVRSESTAKDGWPTVYFVAAHELPLPRPLAPGVTVRGRPGDATFGYYGEHTRDVHVTLEIVAVGADELVGDLTVVTEDVLYGGERARPTTAVARLRLVRTAPEELWDPRADAD